MSKQPNNVVIDTELLAEGVRRRDAALIALDMTWARNVSPFHVYFDDLALLAGMHKVRYNIVTIPEALRHESAAWLRANGFSDIKGLPLLPPGQLPT
jgi:hypothetical protein